MEKRLLWRWRTIGAAIGLCLIVCLLAACGEPDPNGPAAIESAGATSQAATIVASSPTATALAAATVIVRPVSTRRAHARRRGQFRPVSTPIPQGDDAAPAAHAVGAPALPAGVTSSGCMIGTPGHSVVSVYSESPYAPASDCNPIARGDYAYTSPPNLSRLTRYCTASKNDGSATLDVYDRRDDLALPAHPEIGTVANAVCAIYQSNSQWTVQRDMALVPTYIPSSSTGAAAETATPTDVTSSNITRSGDSVASDQGGTGPTAECYDGTTSYSHHPSGTCSHHGGVATWDDTLPHASQ